MNKKELKATIKQILEKAEHYEWSLQGFGMLRLYLSKETRLHVWDGRYAVPKVSEIHDHPWDFKSTVIAGILQNFRYRRVEQDGMRFATQRILCGPNGCAMGDIGEALLQQVTQERYEQGQSYSQNADEIHRSEPACGTVTIVTRAFKADPDHANVFWRPDERWVSAEPRQANEREVRAITRYALEAWF